MTTTTKKPSKAAELRLETEGAIVELRRALPPGSIVRPVLRHVSRSGMRRRIDFYAFPPGSTRRGGGSADCLYLSGLIRHALGMRFGPQGEGLIVDGCGMDMGFHVVYSLSRVLYRDGFECIGEGCPSHEHSGGPAPRKGKTHTRDGGYALRCEWL